MLVCTSICTNYIPKAAALADSYKKVNPNIKFLVCLTEREIPVSISKFINFDYVILSKDIGIDNFEEFIFKHSIVEASTAVKGQLFKYMFDTFVSEDKFIYLDPDIIVYSDLVEIYSLLDSESIILTPHLLKPGNISMEFSTLIHGTFNLGFLAVRRSAESIRFINWWSSRLYEFCYDNKSEGLFTDQKWINLAPCFFDVYTLKHYGYNFATWNLLTRRLTKKDNKYFSEEDSLRFIHYSGIDSGMIDWAITQWLKDDITNPFIDLYRKYKETLNDFGHNDFSNIPWSYSTYYSGEKISSITREIYKRLVQIPIKNPFELSNEAITKIRTTSTDLLDRQ